MSEVDFDNLNYEQFEVSVNNTMKEIQKAKRRQISKNKSLKARLIIKVKEYNKLEKKVMDYIFFPYHSDLIPTLEVLKKLKKWIKEIIMEKTGKEFNPTFKMYFKATVDGDINFHDKTDKWDGYLLIIKDENENIFGGYTSKNFRGNLALDIGYGAYKNDNMSFLFNLDKEEIYPVVKQNSDYHIYADIEEGPIFGELLNSDLNIKTRFLSVKSFSNFPKNYNLKGDMNDSENKLRLTNGQKSFLIKELECFRIILLT